jgi:hypothetical protein
MRILEKAQEGKLVSAFIPVSKVVSYDIANLKLEINHSFSLTKDLDSQLKVGKHSESLGGIDLRELTDLGLKIM